MKHILDSIYAETARIVFDSCEKMLPAPFFLRVSIDKKGGAFKRYLELLRLYVFMLKKIQKRGPLCMHRLQERRLGRILLCAEKTKWWKEYFKTHNLIPRHIRTLSDLTSIPPVTRFDLTSVPKKDLLTRAETDGTIVWRNSGGSTTGTPFVWGLNKSLLFINVCANFLRELELRGFPFEQNKNNNFYLEYNWAPGTDRSEFKYFSEGDFTLKISDATFEEKILSLSHTLKKLERGIVRINSNELSFLIEELRMRDLHPPVAFFSLTGSPLDDEIRKRAVDYFNCQILLHYGAQEMGPLSIECREHRRFYHTFSERVIVEILDDDGHPVPTGQTGNVTITILDNTVMPLIRYQPGDRGALHTDRSCTCKNKTPLLEIAGRPTDILHFSDGSQKSVSPIMKRFKIEPLVSSVRQFQIRQDALDEVTILYEIRHSIRQEVLETFKKKIEDYYGPNLKVILQEVPLIPQDTPKLRVFVPLKT